MATTSHPDANANANANEDAPRPLHVVFVHLDLGIGGAEQLVLQLARASRDLGHRVEIVTTRCDSDHCFADVKKPDGILSGCVSVYGQNIPPNIAGVATALMSTVRMIYLTYKVVSAIDDSADDSIDAATTTVDGKQTHTQTQTQTLQNNKKYKHKSADVVVVDVLPTSLPLLLGWMATAGVLFYCHFPDKLLLRNNRGGILKKWYRKLLDAVEESTMGLSDTLVVNSRFTLGMVERHFPLLSARRTNEQRKHQQSRQQQQHQQQQQRNQNQNRLLEPIEVLYPALDTSNMVQANNRDKTNRSPIVSLNRFERKKNIGLVIRAYAYIMNDTTMDKELPPLVIAGGYDRQNAENVEHRAELGAVAKELGVPVDFRLDISDKERADLFQTALCVVYTPDKEHFGIVPLEAMYAGTPVLAVNSGGPVETVRDGETGFLREPNPGDFGRALLDWIQKPELATAMGRAGRKHVEAVFGTKRFETEWKLLLQETKAAAVRRRANNANANANANANHLVLWANVLVYAAESLIALLAVLLATWILRRTGVLGSSQSIVGALRSRLVGGDEL